MARITIGIKDIGDGFPCYTIAEIGINHNGDRNCAFDLIDEAKDAGFDAVKFQCRTPRLCVPRDQWDVIKRGTPWGDIPYIEYREHMELTEDDWTEIAIHCALKRIDWFASVWDEQAAEFLEQWEPVAFKVPSAKLTDQNLLEVVCKLSKARNIPVILSTGMSTTDQIIHAVSTHGWGQLALMQCTSTYPCAPEYLNLRVVERWKKTKPFSHYPIGYSGHETGLATTVASVVLGADLVERHVTLDRAMWGSDQAASVEPQGMRKLIRDVRTVEKALGDGVKRVYAVEHPSMRKLRGST